MFGCPNECITKLLLALMLRAGDTYFYFFNPKYPFPKWERVLDCRSPALANAGWDYWRAEELLCLIWLEGKELKSPFGRAV